MPPSPALLMLADGTSFPGVPIGAKQDAFGEIVFNTSQTGYQEILTDPSYTGQIVNFTFPHIGNYGVNPEANESPTPKAAGLICTELSPDFGHWRSKQSLSDWLMEHNISGISEVDTRALTLHLRKHGAMNGYISATDLNPASLLEKAQALPPMSGLNLAEQAGCKEAYDFSTQGERTVAVLDLGVKRSILDQLVRVGFSVKVWPGDTAAETIIESGAVGLLLSNGPGDPAPCGASIATVQNILGKMPLFGICLGHQILALALGGKTFKLPFGHRGANHPVRDEANGSISVTSQNHGFCVVREGLPAEAVITHINANDKTIEGLASPRHYAMSVQYHPEAGPGPLDAHHLFDEFRVLVEKFHQARG